jgi:beta-galactosidase
MRYFLQFDAVGNVADVWLNGQYLGKHAGAFARFRFDATAAILPGKRNVLVVKADNSRPQPGSSTAAVIPLSGDFFVFGGIYRSVALIGTSPTHVDMLDYGGPGVYAHATSIEAGEAVVQVSARVVNDGGKPEKVSVDALIRDADGKVIASAAAQSIELGRTAAVVPFTLHVPQPRLWQGMKDPYLYRAVVSVRSPKGDYLDEVSQPLGLRTVAFDPDKGFFLNGQHLLLHGAAMHQDRPVKGWAISRADQLQDLDYLVDMGGNAVRFAHYQHDQASYEIADQKGIVVWAEIPLVNHVSFDGTPASTALAANATQQLLELIHQNYNHPSIAVWSIANEVDLRATQAKGPSQPLSLLESLNKLAKSEDPTRFTAMADCCEVGLPPHRRADQGSNAAPAAARDQIVGITDVVGYNRYFGWYDGKFSDFGAFLDEAHARHPKLPLSISEYGAGAALTQHSEDPMATPINSHGRPHPEEYQELYHEASWAELQARPYLWGVFIWNMFDFASDSRNEGDSTDINDKGMVSYDRSVAKDAFYFYRANWNSQPTLHLVGRRFVQRQQAVVDVKAYSNATQAHLRVNDHDLGAATCTGGICLWHGVQLSKGTNDVRATATIGGSEVTDSLRWTLQ